MNQKHFIKFYKEFYGYGDWSTPDWFLGIEEGGGGNIDHVIQKLHQFYYWNNIKEGLVDNFEFQSLLDECRLGGFLNANNNGGPNAQTTWIHPLKALLYNHFYKIENPEGWPTLIEAKMAQIINLGRIGASGLNSTWVELFPLPNPRKVEYSRWQKWTSHFEENWRLPFNRRHYEDQIAEERINFIRDKITLYRPKNIIAYIGTDNRYESLITSLSGLDINKWNIDIPVVGKNILYFDYCWDAEKNQKTRFFRCYHPSRTNNNIYWRRVGELMIL